MKLLPLVVLVILGFGCDTPTKLRRNDFVGANSLGAPTTTSGSTTGTTTGATTSTTSGSTAGQTTGTPATGEFSACNTNYSSLLSGYGYMSVCQSSVNESYFRLGFGFADSSDQTCIIPTYRDGNSNSTYLGNPQCTFHNMDQVILGNTYKNRSGYTQYPINGVMVMKKSSTASYYDCMNAYDRYFSACVNSGRNPNTCDYEAKQDMTNKCNQFKSRYPYIDIRAK